MDKLSKEGLAIKSIYELEDLPGTLSAGVGQLGLIKNAPHPNAAWLFARWVASEEGQAAYAQGSRNPAHPKVEPVEKTRPQKIYALAVADYKDFPKYEKIWKEIFGLR